MHAFLHLPLLRSRKIFTDSDLLGLASSCVEDVTSVLEQTNPDAVVSTLPLSPYQRESSTCFLI